MGRKKKPADQKLIPIIFKVTPELWAAYEVYGKTVRDSAGNALSAPMAARELAFLGLKTVGRAPKVKKS